MRPRNVFEDFEALTNAIANARLDFFNSVAAADGRDLDDWFRADSELLKPVPIEISESNDTYQFDPLRFEIRVECSFGNAFYKDGIGGDVAHTSGRGRSNARVNLVPARRDRRHIQMTLLTGDGVAVEDQRPEGEDRYRHSQDQRDNAIHTPHVQDVGFDICEVESVGKSYPGKVDGEDYAA